MPEGTPGAVVSISTEVALDDTDELPARSVATAVIDLVPSATGTVVHSNTPDVESAAQVEPDGVPSTDNCTVAPASAVPDTDGVVSLVIPSAFDDPESDAEVTARPVGADGAV
jgi:hypothetical protein